MEDKRYHGCCEELAAKDASSSETLYRLRSDVNPKALMGFSPLYAVLRLLILKAQFLGLARYEIYL